MRKTVKNPMIKPFEKGTFFPLVFPTLDIFFYTEARFLMLLNWRYLTKSLLLVMLFLLYHCINLRITELQSLIPFLLVQCLHR